MCVLYTFDRHTEFKQLMLCVQFPKDYPQERLVVELKSKTIPEKLIDGLVNVCDQELSKHTGNTQVRLIQSKAINNKVYTTCTLRLLLFASTYLI